ncbi:MAG: hypothetical protein LBL31_06630 [Spirochaetaceae bacterium]|jgi:hypothetical protein|nr:hypothetical protein [Spirochaetaceae bacterium]
MVKAEIIVGVMRVMCMTRIKEFLVKESRCSFRLPVMLLAMTLTLTASLTLTGCGEEEDPRKALEETGPAVAVTDLILTYKLPAPVADKAPTQNLAAGQYTGTVAWSVTANGGAVSSGHDFQSGTAYTATARLTAASGYAFAGTPAFTHARAAVMLVSSNGDGTFTVTMDFPVPDVYYVDAVNGDDSKNGGTAGTAFKTLDQALKVTGHKTICLVGGFTIDGGSKTIDGAGGTTITRTDVNDWQSPAKNYGWTDAVITVTGGAQVSFKNITIDGKNTGNPSAFHRGLLVTGAGTTVTLDTGTTVTGKTGGASITANGGGGIRINDGASLVMTGDSVVKDSEAPVFGGGVCVDNGSSFTMEGSSAVKNNSVAGNFGGGGVYTFGMFSMSGSPVISLNKATSGGGVFQNGGTFTMTGGTIYGTNEPSKANTAPNGGAAYYRQAGTSSVTPSDDTIRRP